MSIGLVVEVLDNAPDTLTSGERLVLVVIAEWANDKTREARQTHNWNLDTICRRAGIKRSGLKAALQGLAKKELEVRVPVKWKDGKPIYAFEGTALTFKVPHFGERGGPGIPTQRGGHSISSDARGDAVASERGGHSIGEGTPQPPPSPQDSPLKKNPSSLSPRETEPAAAPSVPAQREREVESASQEEPKTQDPIHRMLIKHGCPADRVEAVKDRIGIIRAVQHDGFYFTANDNGSLTTAVADALQDLNAKPAAPAMTYTEYKASLAGQPDCDHQEPGGNIPRDGDGWMHCARCRLRSGWINPASKVNEQHGRNDRQGLDRHGNGRRLPPNFLADSRAPGRNYSERL